jgi:hypothetical protein
MFCHFLKFTLSPSISICPLLLIVVATFYFYMEGQEVRSFSMSQYQEWSNGLEDAIYVPLRWVRYRSVRHQGLVYCMNILCVNFFYSALLSFQTKQKHG